MTYYETILPLNSHAAHFKISAERMLYNSRNNGPHIMIVFGLNHLSDITADYGPITELELTCYVQDILKAYIPEPNLFCPLTSDTFAVFLENFKDIDVALLVIQLTEEISSFQKQNDITLSFGICKETPFLSNVLSLYNCALYAKESVKIDSLQFLADYSELEPALLK
jgi:GGDEF domain-containing protein